MVRWDDYKYAKGAEDFSLSLFPVLMVEKVTDKASACAEKQAVEKTSDLHKGRPQVPHSPSQLMGMSVPLLCASLSCGFPRAGSPRIGFPGLSRCPAKICGVAMGPRSKTALSSAQAFLCTQCVQGIVCLRTSSVECRMVHLEQAPTGCCHHHPWALSRRDLGPRKEDPSL